MGTSKFWGKFERMLGSLGVIKIPQVKKYKYIILTNIFNKQTVLLQLRVRDLEGALEVEKSAVDEAKHNLETLTKQHRFVKRIHDLWSPSFLLSHILYL